jgi:hypothetical protein
MHWYPAGISSHGVAGLVLALRRALKRILGEATEREGEAWVVVRRLLRRAVRGNNFGPVLSLQFRERIAFGQAAAEVVDNLLHFAFTLARRLGDACSVARVSARRFHVTILTAVILGNQAHRQ